MNSIVDLYKDDIANKTPGTFYCVINVEPYTKSNRLQFGGGRAFVPASFKKKDQIVKLAARAAMTAYGIGPFAKPVLMQIDGYLSTKRVFDTCNLPKSVPDALNGILYYDDRQIIICTATKHYDKLNPRVEIFIKEFDIEHPCVNIKPILEKVTPNVNGPVQCSEQPEAKQAEGVQRVRRSNRPRKTVQVNE